MLKNILMVVGAALLAVVLSFTGIKFYTAYQAAQYNDTVVPLLQEVIPEMSTWQEDVFRKHISPEALEKVSPEKFTAIINKFSKLGALKTFEKPKFEEVADIRSDNALMNDNTTRTTVTYTSNAEYENGEALITIKFVVNGEQLDIYYFNIQSMTLMD